MAFVTGAILSHFDFTAIHDKWWLYMALAVDAIPEGPFGTVIGGSLSRQGIVLWYAVYLIMVTGDIIGDGLWYAVGRYAGPVLLGKIEKFFGFSEDDVANVEKKFSENLFVTLLGSKVIHGFGLAGLIAAGRLKIPYFEKYLPTCFLVSLMQSATLLTIGFVFGGTPQVIKHYLNLYAGVVSIAAITVAVILFTIKKIKNGKK